MTSDDFVEQTLHTDLILELTGEYLNSSETREDRLLRKFREENDTLHDEQQCHPEHSTACNEISEERLDRKPHDDEFEHAKHILALTAARDFSWGYRRRESFRIEHDTSQESEDVTNRGATATLDVSRVPAPPTDNVISRRILLRPPWQYRAKTKLHPVEPTIANSTTNFSAPGAYLIQGGFEADELAPPQPDLVVTPSIQKIHHRCLLHLLIGFLLLFLIGILVAFLLDHHHENHVSIIVSDPITCTLDDIYAECQIEGVTVFQSDVPECAFSSYLSLELDFLPLEFPMIPFPSVIISCEPENLALLTLATHGEKSRDKFIRNTIYFAMDGHTWTDNRNWLSSESVCSWCGVACHNDAITEIDLSYAGLNGTIPSIVGQLDELQVLNLQANLLHSTIPEVLWQLPKLTNLDLSHNPFDDGPIPSHLSKMERIESLKLTGSHLTGALTGNVFAGLTNLRILEMEWNALTGSIPPEFSLLTNLASLSLTSNLLTGSIPSELSQLTALEKLSLSGCTLTGKLPSEVGLLTSLNTLSFSWNKLSGTIPKEVCALWDTAPLVTFGGGKYVEFLESDETEIQQFFGGLTCPSLECCRTCPLAFKG